MTATDDAPYSFLRPTARAGTRAEPAVAPVSDEERILRRDLAACYRLMALFGWDDLVGTHISARQPDSEDFLINPFGMAFDEITASSLVKINAEGEVVDDSPWPINQAGFVIHSAVHLARPDAGCVIHLHTRDGAAVSAVAEGILPLNATAMTLAHDVATHDFEGLSVEMGERERLAADLGTKHRMLLRNHGTLALGQTVAEAFYRMYTLEWSCTVQVRTLGMNRPLHELPAGMWEKVQRQATPAMTISYACEMVWPAMLRKLDRENPGYDA